MTIFISGRTAEEKKVGTMGIDVPGMKTFRYQNPGRSDFEGGKIQILHKMIEVLRNNYLYSL